jgi:choice-of-anchor C domain-containing protein
MKKTLCLLGFMIAGVELCSGQLVVNGSFETGPTPPYGGLYIPAPDSSTIPGWTVSNGSIDYVGSDYWQPADGSRSLDMDGHNPGTIMQNVSGLTVGQLYKLSFYMAGNNNFSPVTFHLQASVGSNSQTFTFDATGYSYTNMGWTLKTLDFTATATAMPLTFTSLDPGFSGPTLDEVSIVAIPEPCAGMLFCTAAVLTLRRRLCRR